MKAKTNLILILGAIAMTLGLMQFSSHGSFNPEKLGFYTSIGAGVVWYVSSYFIFRRFIISNSKDQNANRKEN